MFVFVSSPYHLKLSYMGTTRNLQVVLTTPNKSLPPKKIFAKFSYSKNPGKFQTPKNPLIIPVI